VDCLRRQTHRHQARQIVTANSRERSSDPTPGVPTADDLHLLDALVQDGRGSHAELARATGWSVARVARRLAALESSHTLLCDVDLLPERLGYQLNAVLWMTLSPEHTHAVGTELAPHDQIAFVAATTGPRNVMAVALCRNEHDLYRYLSGPFAAVGHIAAYEISVRTELLKQSASLVSHGRLTSMPMGKGAGIRS
jgi:DNA-binding Lrp family transcriptional regulator